VTGEIGPHGLGVRPVGYLPVSYRHHRRTAKEKTMSADGAPVFWDRGVEGLGAWMPSGNEAIPLEGMTIRDLVAELTWVQDHRRARAPDLAGADDDDELDPLWLRHREDEICAELRRRRGQPAVVVSRSP